MRPPIRETIADRYELLEVIGQGGQALVFKARDRQEERLVAVKMMSKMVSRDPLWVERMAREQQAMVALAGTNAVGFIDMCTSKSGALCLVMELLSGKDLEQHLKRREARGERMSIEQMVELMSPIVDTLEKAHAVGIVHRDLKPGNIFVLSEEDGGAPRLLDFGFARTKTSKQVTEAGTILGSPSYIAPEMWLALPEGVDPRADVYSLGVILFRILSGELPFKGDTLQEKFVAATTAERPSLHKRRRDLSNNVDIWVERALAIDPDDRFPTVRACWGELLWALGLAPHPTELRTPGLAQSLDVRRVREWLETPINALPKPLNAAWRMATEAIGRLKRLGKAETGLAPAETPSPRPAASRKSAENDGAVAFAATVEQPPAQSTEPSGSRISAEFDGGLAGSDAGRGTPPEDSFVEDLTGACLLDEHRTLLPDEREREDSSISTRSGAEPEERSETSADAERFQEEASSAPVGPAAEAESGETDAVTIPVPSSERSGVHRFEEPADADEDRITVPATAVEALSSGMATGDASSDEGAASSDRGGESIESTAAPAVKTSPTKASAAKRGAAKKPTQPEKRVAKKTRAKPAAARSATKPVTAKKTPTAKRATVKKTQTKKRAAAKKTQTKKSATAKKTQTKKSASAKKTQTKKSATAKKTQAKKSATAKKTKRGTAKKTGTTKRASTGKVTKAPAAKKAKGKAATKKANHRSKATRRVVGRSQPNGTKATVGRKTAARSSTTGKKAKRSGKAARR